VAIYPERPESIDVMLLFDRTKSNGLLFDAPGVYTIAASFTFNLFKNADQVTAVLPPTTITVSPARPEDAAALKLADNPKFIQALHLGVAPTTDTVTLFSKIADSYPQSHVGQLALRAVGMTLAKSEDPAERTRGAGLLQRLLADSIIRTGRDNIAWQIAGA